ncbi:MAG: GTP-binding protein [Anaerovoracaceae bacterium]
MTKIDIFSGFLGAGKTTLIKKLIQEAYVGEKVVLIENEFGEIGIDGGFLRDAGVEINEMNSGCICCSLVGDFGRALEKVLAEFSPDRILIEPSGVGKLSDVIRAVENVHDEHLVLNGFTTIVDAKKCKMYIHNFGEFYNNQIEHASSIIFSHTTGLSQEKLDDCVALIREYNGDASIVTTPWEEITGKQILETMEKKSTIQVELEHLEHEEHDHHHHHEEHHHHDDDCTCGCHDHEEHDHHHHHHDHEEHHHHDDDCTCGCHDHDHDHEHEHDHEGHHHADEVFTSFGAETAHKFESEKITQILTALQDENEYGMVLRAKGIVAASDGKWIHFDYVPGEPDVRFGTAEVTGRLCVIGKDIDEAKIKSLFEL